MNPTKMINLTTFMLKCYSHILFWSAENFRFWLFKFVLIWWQSDKKTRNPEAELQGLVFNFIINCWI